LSYQLEKPKKEMTAAIAGNAGTASWLQKASLTTAMGGWAVSRDEPVESVGEGRLRFNRLSLLKHEKRMCA